MKSFLNLQEAVDYVPTCLICGKNMRMTIDTSIVTEIKGKTRSVSSQRTYPRIEMQMVDGKLQSKHKQFDICINPITNEITVGAKDTQNFIWESTFFRKTCPTCHCKISMNCPRGAKSKEIPFPTLTLGREELHFTMKGGKSIRIDKYHRNDDDNKNASIRFDEKYLPPLPFDFGKFNNFEQLINRIQTLILFH